MPGPAFGLELLDWQKPNLGSFHVKTGGETVEHRFLTMHLHCASGVACTGPGCRANTGKTRRNRGR